MSVEKPLSQDEMQGAEEAAMRILQNCLNAFTAYPTPRNAKLVVERMEEYQAAWMNGRRRTYD